MSSVPKNNWRVNRHDTLCFQAMSLIHSAIGTLCIGLLAVVLLTLAFKEALPAQSPFLRTDRDNDPAYSGAYRYRLRELRERVAQNRKQWEQEQAREKAEEQERIQRERLFPKKDDGLSGFDSRPTRKVYGVDNRGDRELYPELIIEPSIYDRYEVYETDRDGLKKWEPKAIIKQGLHDRYEVYRTDRDGRAVDEPHLIIEEGRHGDQKVYETDRYGMREDIPSRVIKTDRRGRQEVYRTDRYGMPIGDPIDEKILE